MSESGWAVAFAASDTWVNKIKPMLEAQAQACAESAMFDDEDLERKRGEFKAYRSIIEMFELEGA